MADARGCCEWVDWGLPLSFLWGELFAVVTHDEGKEAACVFCDRVGDCFEEVIHGCLFLLVGEFWGRSLISKIIGIDDHGAACEGSSGYRNEDFNEWVHGMCSFLCTDGW